MEWLLKITEDLFDIAKRLKEIDERYVVYRNLKADRFEVHADGVLQVAVPFKRLDARTVELVRSTRIEYADRLIKDMEKQNARLKRAHENSARESIMEKVEEIL